MTTPKIIIAVHGVGDQRRSETVRHVAWRFATLLGQDVRKPALGYFHPEAGARARAVQLPAGLSGESLAPDYYFAEVYWADIAADIAEKGRALEETKEWGWSVIWRARARSREKQTASADKGAFKDTFLDAGHVIEDIVESIGVLSNLLVLVEKAGVFRFDLGRLLRDFAGDVQLVADFQFARRQIVDHFGAVLDEVFADVVRRSGSTPEVHIVAHSEGTVVSFLALQEAITADKASWIPCLRQYMTIGSPLDIHRFLWPEIFPSKPAAWPAKLMWTNYYDYGDPIGLGTSATKKWAMCPDANFDEISFSRYFFPGAAHNEYWKDADLFAHFFGKVAGKKSDSEREAKAPKSVLKVRLVAYLLPFLLVYSLHASASYVLLHALRDVLPELRFGPTATALGMGGVLVAVTAAARLPYLIPRTIILRWLLPPLALTGAVAGATYFLQPFAASAAVVAFGVIVTSWIGGAVYQPKFARRVLLASGAASVVGAVALLGGQPAWEMVSFWWSLVAGGTSLYLWWLGLLIFELTVVWHKYIRNEKLHASLESRAPTAPHMPQTATQTSELQR